MKYDSPRGDERELTLAGAGQALQLARADMRLAGCLVCLRCGCKPMEHAAQEIRRPLDSAANETASLLLANAMANGEARGGSPANNSGAQETNRYAPAKKEPTRTGAASSSANSTLPSAPSGSAAGSDIEAPTTGYDDEHHVDEPHVDDAWVTKVTIHKERRRDRLGITLAGDGRRSRGCRPPLIAAVATDGLAADVVQPGLRLISVNGAHLRSHREGTRLLKAAKNNITLVMAPATWGDTERSHAPAPRRSLAERASSSGVLQLSALRQGEVERVLRGLRPEVEALRSGWMSDSSHSSSSSSSSESELGPIDARGRRTIIR